MKSFLVAGVCLITICVIAVSNNVNANPAPSEIQAVAVDGTCGGDCTSSALCASNANNTLCRCSYLTCQVGDRCSGGCTLDSQCRNWAGGDANCVCTWWFECDYKTNVKNPGYRPFLKIAQMKKLKQDTTNIQQPLDSA